MRRSTKSLLWLSLAVLPLIAIGTLTVRALVRAEAQTALLQLQAEATLAADAAAGSLLLSEAMRPADAWRAFAQPGVIVDGRTQGATLDRWWVPSPLLYGTEKPALLHFEVRPDGTITSPQVVAGRDLVRAEGIRPAAFPASAYEQKLTELQHYQVAWVQLAKSLPGFEGASGQQLGRDSSQAVIADRRNNPLPVEGQQAHQDVQETDPAQTKRISKQFASRKKLQEKNIELQNRFNSSTNNSAVNFPSNQQERQEAAQGNEYAYLSSQVIEQIASDELPQTTGKGAATQHAVAPHRIAQLGAMRGVWIGDELFFLRRMTTDQGSYLQGVWMDAEATAAFCTEAMGEILPGARIVPLGHLNQRGDSYHTQAAPMPLANLPFYVLAPSMEMALNPETVALLWALAIAGFIAVIAAALLVLFASSLAERRAAFVSAVTHELRTPLTAVRLHADLLANERVGNDPERRQKAVRTLRESGTRLASLVDNVLDYARLERRRSPRREGIAVASLLQHGLLSWRQRLDQVGLVLDLAAEYQRTEMVLRGDREAVQRILDNIVDNACKYAIPSDPQEIHMTVLKRGKYGVINVRDFGPGLPNGKLPKPGERSAEEAAGHAPGIGLGLELCRRLAKAMGGSLHLIPQQPGLLIQLRLPLATESSPEIT